MKVGDTVYIKSNSYLKSLLISDVGFTITEDCPLEVVSINYPKVVVRVFDFISLLGRAGCVGLRTPVHPYKLQRSQLFQLDIKEIKTCWKTP